MSISLADMPGAATSIIAEGWHNARLCGLIDLGTQENKFESHGAKRFVAQIALVFELADSGERLVNIYNKSMYPASKLRRELVQWRGRDFADGELEHFQLSQLLGRSVLVNVAHRSDANGNIWHRIAGLKSCADTANAAACAELPEHTLFDLSDDSTWGNFTSVPAWLQRIINEATELKDSGLRLDEHGKRIVRDPADAMDDVIIIDPENEQPVKRPYSPSNLPF